VKVAPTPRHWVLAGVVAIAMIAAIGVVVTRDRTSTTHVETRRADVTVSTTTTTSTNTTAVPTTTVRPTTTAAPATTSTTTTSTTVAEDEDPPDTRATRPFDYEPAYFSLSFDSAHHLVVEWPTWTGAPRALEAPGAMLIVVDERDDDRDPRVGMLGSGDLRAGHAYRVPRAADLRYVISDLPRSPTGRWWVQLRDGADDPHIWPAYWQSGLQSIDDR
jgi:hypothetical protein